MAIGSDITDLRYIICIITAAILLYSLPPKCYSMLTSRKNVSFVYPD